MRWSDKPSARRLAVSKRAAARIAARLRDERGFMLAEQLVSVIFLGLLSVAVAAGLGAAMAAYGAITATSNANMLLAETVQQVNDELAFSISAEDGSATFVSAATRTSVTMASGDEGIVLSPTQAGAAPITLVAETNGLSPSFTSPPVYQAAANTWTYAVAVSEAGGSQLAAQTMTVARVNPPDTA